MSSLDNLRTTAKRWLKAIRSGDANAVARFRRLYPSAPAAPGLRDVQHALALERGAVSWAALKRGLADTTTDSSEHALAALLQAAHAGDAARVTEIADAHPRIVSLRGAMRGHTGLRTALHFGIAHEAVVRTLLEHGADPNVRDEGDNAMPLHFAAENQHLPIIRLLIAHGADPIGEGDTHELEVIGWACCWDYRAANREVVDYLVAHGARHTVFSAVATGEVEIVRRLISAAPELLSRRMDRTNKRRTPLHLAIVKQQADVAAALIDLGADLDALDAAGLTPLDQAALDGGADLADTLIAHGAAVRLPAAVALGRTADIARLIEQHPDDLRPAGRFGTLLVRASAHSPAAVIETLIRLGADVGVREAEDTAVDQTSGYTALHAAAFNNNEAAARVLLRHGADVNARESKYGSTPAGWAHYAGHRHLRDLILRGPIDIHQAIEFDLTERIPQLLKTDPAALNRLLNGSSPLAWAVTRGNVEAARFLAEEGAELVMPDDDRQRMETDPRAGRILAMIATVRSAPREQRLTTSTGDPIENFIRFACWDHHVHGKSDHRLCDDAAQRLLKQHPDLAAASIYTAVICGNLPEVARLIGARPECAIERGGPRDQTPLLYLTYTRLTHAPAIENAVAIATLLLDHGADANDYYMAGHSRYCALVGVAREGEQDAPPHPRREELFQLLLERGAYPYDIQVLYNTHFSGDVLWWLRRVYDHTMATGRKAEWEDPEWPMFDMGGYGSGARFLLWIAIRKNDPVLAEWVLARGANPNSPPATDPRFSKRSLYEDAVLDGRKEIADLLLRFGAVRVDPALTDEEAFVDAVRRHDFQQAHALLTAHPEYLRSTTALFDAANRDDPEAARLLLDLGVSPDVANSQNERALHQAAIRNSLRVLGLLVERGAEIDPRDGRYDSAPIGWAAHADHRAAMDLLSAVSRDVWTLAFGGYVSRLREVLHADPALARATRADGMTVLWWLPDDEAVAIQVVDLLLAHGADAHARSDRGTTAAEWARRRGMQQVAGRLEAQGNATREPSGGA